jgi:hypothetical protein
MAIDRLLGSENTEVLTVQPESTENIDFVI